MGFVGDNKGIYIYKKYKEKKREKQKIDLLLVKINQLLSCSCMYSMLNMQYMRMSYNISQTEY